MGCVCSNMLSRGLAVKCGVDRLDRLGENGFKSAFESEHGENPNTIKILKMHETTGSKQGLRHV